LNWFHVDDHSYKLTDDPICKDNYDEEVLVLKEKKQFPKSIPNIVLIVMDDASNYVDPMFDAMPFTSKLFRLNGTEFVNAFTSTSFCCPARCQIFTGMYGHNNGVISSGGSYSSMEAFLKPLYLNESRQINPSNKKCINNLYRSINMYLKQKNYTNGMFGKYLNGHESSNPRFHSMKFVPPGWDKFDMCVNNYMYIGNMYVMAEWEAGKSVQYKWYGREEKDYLTDVIGRKSTNFINQHNYKNPLFLYVASTAPHGPMTAPYRHRDKLKLWDEKFDEFISSRPNYHNQESVKTKSSWIRNNEDRDDLLRLRPFYHKKDQINIHKLEFRRRMGSYYALDEMIKSIYDEFVRKGEIDNTVFILTSDNGFNEGAQGFGHKMTGYEESIRVPFFISGYPFKKGYKDYRLALLNDISPTILDLIGLEKPKHMDGLSLIGNVKRYSILLEYGKRKSNEKYTGSLNEASEFKMITDIAPKALSYDVHPYIGIRTDRFTLLEYYNLTESEETECELYDLKRDPFQLTNLINNKVYYNITKSLQNRLRKLENCYGDECNII
jgi:arylsulfatase A-like enzyme